MNGQIIYKWRYDTRNVKYSLVSGLYNMSFATVLINGKEVNVRFKDVTEKEFTDELIINEAKRKIS